MLASGHGSAPAGGPSRRCGFGYPSRRRSSRPSAGRRIAVEHWQDAADQGAVAGASAAGVDAEWNGVPGFWTTIGDSDVKYHAWGDGYQDSRMLHRDDGFTVWYESGGATVGVLTLNADDDYGLGERLIKEGAPAPVPMR